nr:immunoglobulin light chain junction region [Macaca mulatta]MOW04419.1 immunoglobulin light chain junction region [Macaca mulatta]MOW04662.1 immunoglobulin light chain junction region [Macaca mulatta]MOW04944.1 immunoglobulin light chain junction region [Macaca mulatta]MOW06257.1 immunoglobulin light chain junction region [Macaca mulatta]
EYYCWLHFSGIWVF